MPCLTTSIESPEVSKEIKFPSEYRELAEVLSKTKATQLLPHRPWDCAIELLTNAAPPASRVCPLSHPESLATESYIEEGFIRP